MDLILWRHAEAEDSTPDLARKLTAKGHQQAEKMAHWLNSRLAPDTRILVSPAVRAQETAAALKRPFTTINSIAPDANAKAILIASDWPLSNHPVMIVGHQPTLGEVAAYLLSDQNTSFSVKKGAIWWFTTTHSGSFTSSKLRASLSPDLV